jgi:tetratricopeptide (TPR) repeat protein
MKTRPLNKLSLIIAPLAIFLIAFAIRLFYIFTSKDNPFFTIPIVDMQYYWDLAGQICSRGIWGISQHDIAWKPILYPIFLSLLRIISHDNILVAKAFQSFIGALNCSLLYFLGCRFFPSRTAAIAGFLMAFYGTFIIYDAMFVPVTLSTFFVLTFFIAVTYTSVKQVPYVWAIPGALVAFATNTHQIVIAIVPVFPIILHYFYRRTTAVPKSRRITELTFRFSWFLAGLLVVTFSIGSLKYFQKAGIAPPTNNAGINFFIGNNLTADGVSTPPMGIKWLRLINRPVLEGTVRKEDVGHSTYFIKRTIADIRQDPLRFLWLYGKKVLFCFSGIEIRNNVDKYRLAAASWITRPLLWETCFFAFPFGILFPLALVGIVSVIKQYQWKLVHFYLFLLIIPLGIGLFFVCARYRMLIVPILILFAAVALNKIANRLRQKRLQFKPAFPLVIFCIGFIISNGTNGYLINVNERQIYLDFFNLGRNQFAHYQQLDVAEENLKRAITINPQFVDSYYYLAGVHREKHHNDSAKTVLEQVLSQDPEFQEARELLAEIEIAHSDYKKAELELLKVYCDDAGRYNFTSRSNSVQRLGNLYFSIYGNLPVAAAFFELYLKCNPDERLPANRNIAEIRKFLMEFPERDYSVLANYRHENLNIFPTGSVN